MPNLKDIRSRIKSVKNTQKITQAMRMVAAAKVKRAENRVKSARAYSDALHEVYTLVAKEMQQQNTSLSGSRYLDLFRHRAVKTVGLVIYSSDRGLCGAYNGSVIRQAFHLEREIIERGLVPKFYLVGNKVIQAFSRYSSSEVLGTSANISASPSSSDADLIAQTMSTAFLKGEIDSIDVLSTHFISMISSKVKLSPINPIHSVIDWKPDLLATSSENLASLAKPALKPELLLEPDSVSLLDTLVPMYFSNRLYSLLLEASASELAARMTAMSNASNNAGEMIHNLTIKYNKARQAAITQEILEIVGGAEALK